MFFGRLNGLTIRELPLYQCVEWPFLNMKESKTPCRVAKPAGNRKHQSGNRKKLQPILEVTWISSPAGRPEDAMDLSVFEDESFDVVFDKSTLDALKCRGAEATSSSLAHGCCAGVTTGDLLLFKFQSTPKV